MSATRLAANPSKTKFVFFSGKAERSVRVGDVMIEESGEETLLGIVFNKRMTWRSHLETLKPELQKRIAILRRLRMKLPTRAVCAMIEPLFTAKTRYALELTVDAFEDHGRDTTLKALHQLHRSAMKAALGISTRKHPSDATLFRRTGQVSIYQVAKEATACLAWKCGQDWEHHPLTGGRLERHFSGRNTRQAARSFPPQSTRGSLISRLVEIWERFPEEIYKAEDFNQAKPKIKQWIKN